MSEMGEKSKVRTSFHQKSWFQAAVLVAATVSAVFQVTGPIPNQWLKMIPATLSLVFQRVSTFLAAYGVFLAIAIMCLVAYAKRALLLRGACTVGKLCLFLYVRCFAFLLRPVVHHLLREPPLSGSTPGNQMRQVSSLRILAANYGAGGKFNEVTELLTPQIVGGRLELLVCNNNMGGEPIFGTEKHLFVDYWYSGVRLSKTVKENQMLVLP